MTTKNNNVKSKVNKIKKLDREYDNNLKNELRDHFESFLLNKTNEHFDISFKNNGDIILKRNKFITISHVNQFNKYDFSKSVVTLCLIQNEKINKLKYKKIYIKLLTIINDKTQIINNTTLNIKNSKYEEEGFYYLDELDISIKDVDFNKLIIEIFNQAKKNNIKLQLNINLKNKQKINIQL